MQIVHFSSIRASPSLGSTTVRNMTGGPHPVVAPTENVSPSLVLQVSSGIIGSPL